MLLIVTSPVVPVFQSTHPARGATGPCVDYIEDGEISIHAPREGCDNILDVYEYLGAAFQSTHPARGATGEKDMKSLYDLFQSTHPARGAT